jgi:hypothetical protein
MDINSLTRIERLNYMLGGVLIVVMAFMLSRASALGVVVGVILSCINFSVMRRMVQGWSRQARAGRGNRSYFMAPKMALLMLAVFLAIRLLPITAEGLAIGFSVFLLSIAVETVRYITSPPVNGTSGSSGTDDPKE